MSPAPADALAGIKHSCEGLALGTDHRVVCPRPVAALPPPRLIRVARRGFAVAAQLSRVECGAEWPRSIEPPRTDSNSSLYPLATGRAQQRIGVNAEIC